MMKGMFTDIGIIGLTLLVAFLLAAANGQSVITNTVPNVDSVSIDPSNPTKYNDLICNAQVSDADGNLDYVDFKWYVNSELVRENTRLVYGDLDTESDTLSASFTDASDHVVCEVRVYDFSRAYDYTTHAIHVGNTPTNSIPSLSYVEITPRQR
ncbi:MAG: hypothetical protein KAS04_01425, partial [Candidatus Aenigmarchaeota archaeon]|nr:hypothetical protein [Candidatus Aenigmarchaeota archaeon]